MATASASDDTIPVICEVYWSTARKPPALVAPATKVSDSPSSRLASALRRSPVSRRRNTSMSAPEDGVEQAVERVAGLAHHLAGAGGDGAGAIVRDAGRRAEVGGGQRPRRQALMRRHHDGLPQLCRQAAAG